MNIKELLDLTERKISTYVIYFFLITSVAIPFIALFAAQVNTYKLDLQIIILITTLTMVFRQAKSVNITLRSMDLNKLTPYSSTVTNLTAVEKKLESYNKCELLILGNTLSTIWNSFLKLILVRIKNGDTKTQLDVKLIKRVRDDNIANPRNDPIITAIIKWINENNININLTLYVVSFPLYFTGLCMNKEYLKYRFLNQKTKKEIIGTAIQGTSEIADRTISWFLTLYNDICDSNTPIFEYKNLK